MPQPAPKETIQQWKENILKQLESGLLIASWCRQNNIIVHSFYYWRDKFFPKTNLDRSSFTEIPNEDKNDISNEKTGITIEYQGVCIRLDRQFDSSTLKQCVEVLRKLSC